MSLLGIPGPQAVSGGSGSSMASPVATLAGGPADPRGEGPGAPAGGEPAGSSCPQPPCWRGTRRSCAGGSKQLKIDQDARGGHSPYPPALRIVHGFPGPVLDDAVHALIRIAEVVDNAAPTRCELRVGDGGLRPYTGCRKCDFSELADRVGGSFLERSTIWRFPNRYDLSEVQNDRRASSRPPRKWD